jgi:hypothetical protein
VVLAAAHLDNNPANNRLANLRGFCQRCHMLHDRPFHLAQRWLTYRRRSAIGDLFLGRYGIQPPLAVLLAAAGQTGLSPGRTRVGPKTLPIGSRVDGDWFPPRAVGRTSFPGSAEDLFKPAR